MLDLKESTYLSLYEDDKRSVNFLPIVLCLLCTALLYLDEKSQCQGDAAFEAIAKVTVLQSMCKLTFLPGEGPKIVPQIRGVFQNYDLVHTKKLL